MFISIKRTNEIEEGAGAGNGLAQISSNITSKEMDDPQNPYNQLLQNYFITQLIITEDKENSKIILFDNDERGYGYSARCISYNHCNSMDAEMSNDELYRSMAFIAFFKKFLVNTQWKANVLEEFDYIISVKEWKAHTKWMSKLDDKFYELIDELFALDQYDIELCIDNKKGYCTWNLFNYNQGKGKWKEEIYDPGNPDDYYCSECGEFGWGDLVFLDDEANSEDTLVCEDCKL